MTADVYDRSRQFAAVPFEVIDALQDAKALALYVILKKYANHRTGEAHPSRKTLATKMGYRTPRSVDEAMDVLTARGLVRTFPRYRGQDGEISWEPSEGSAQTSNGYIIYDLPTPPSGGSPLPPEDTPPSTPVPPPLVPGYQGPWYPSTHELEPLELDPLELDGTPLPPPSSGGAPRGAEAGSGEVARIPETLPEKAPAPKPSTRGEFLPEGWEPDRDTIQTMHREFPHLDLRAVHAEFSDYWAGVAGAKGRKRDWTATWRNWVRREGRRSAPYGGGPQAGRGATSRADEKAQGYMALAETLAAQQAAQPAAPEVVQYGIDF